ncbi:unnamed protein product [Phaeothamnion confervicola]
MLVGLNETRVCLGKETAVLSSMAETVDDAFGDRGSQDEFLRQLETIVKGVEAVLAAKQAALRRLELRRRQLLEDDAQLAQERRMYAEAARELRDEAARQTALRMRFGGLRV